MTDPPQSQIETQQRRCDPHPPGYHPSRGEMGDTPANTFIPAWSLRETDTVLNRNTAAKSPAYPALGGQKMTPRIKIGQNAVI